MVEQHLAHVQMAPRPEPGLVVGIRATRRFHQPAPVVMVQNGHQQDRVKIKKIHLVLILAPARTEMKWNFVKKNVDGEINQLSVPVRTDQCSHLHRVEGVVVDVAEGEEEDVEEEDVEDVEEEDVANN